MDVITPPRKYGYGWTGPGLPKFGMPHYQHLFQLAPSRPAIRDLRNAFMAAVFNQGSLGSCVENAWVALMAYVEAMLGRGQEIMSRLQLYYDVRGGVPEDTGSSVGDVVQSVETNGVALESLWPYDLTKWTEKPPDSVYAEAKHRSQGFVPMRLDTLDEILDCIGAGWPVVFGATLYQEYESITAAGRAFVPMPTADSQVAGGHCQMFSGYRDMPATKANAKYIWVPPSSPSYLLVRNSWGSDWGDGGYCRMPYDYAADPNLCSDFWTLRSIDP